MSRTDSASRNMRTSSTPNINITCPPSPCQRLSRCPWWVVTPTTTMRTPSPWDSRPLGDLAFRHRGTSRSNLGSRLIPLNELTVHRPSDRVSSHARGDRVTSDGVGVQTCYRRVYTSTTGDSDSSNTALTLLLRCRRTMPYMFSDISCFPNMLLSPLLFRFRWVGPPQSLF